MKSRKFCSVPDILKKDCSNTVIKAHTISKSASLKSISHDGHVMGLKPKLSSLLKNKGKLELEKIGINNASTITGFCSIHDKELFIPLEDENFIASKKQLFLLAYRPVTRELYAKEGMKTPISTYKESDKGKNMFEQILVQDAASTFEKGVDLGLQDIKNVKIKMDEVLINDTFENLEHYIFELKAPPLIMASASIAPEMDFNGNKIQSLGSDNHELSMIVFNLVSLEKKGYFIFSWLKEHSEISNKFIASLTGHSEERMGDLILGFLYSFCDNIFASPVWWDNLEPKAKDRINERLHHGLFVGMASNNNCLVDDAIEYNAINIGSHYKA